jgi:hypothetical protein
LNSSTLSMELLSYDANKHIKPGERLL